jgi:S-adenosylmethionine synthetase
MAIIHGLFTSESVSEGHPDKLCDQISDVILDAFLGRDPHARVACEALAADRKILIAGEFRTTDPRDFEAVRIGAPALVRRLLHEIGYSGGGIDVDPEDCEIELRFNHQSREIAAGVDRPDQLGAGDQGMMFGYASDETEHLMPLAWTLATELIARGTEARRRGFAPFLRPDAKSQVTVRYADGHPVGIETVVLSWQHDGREALADVREWLQRELVDVVVPAAQRTPAFRVLINPAGAWTVGGPKGDTGLTGRKIIVDTYGGACPHGGGAFSGKDASKVDRSGAYAVRQIAKTIVAAQLARRATVQVAYAIGTVQPVGLYVDTHGTGIARDNVIAAAVEKLFDLTPAGIIERLDLRRPQFRPTASLGHFGRYRAIEGCHWERTDWAADLADAVQTQLRQGQSRTRQAAT